MMILIHNICIAFKGFGNFITVDNVISVKAAMLLKEKYISLYQSHTK